MSIKHTLLLTLALALVASSSASAAGTATITISHQMRGCHMWQLGNDAPKPTLLVTLKAGTVLRFVNNDVMPHKLIQQAGPRLTLRRASMSHMAAGMTVKLVQKGVYRFTTKPGEDYKQFASMKTTGEDYVLRLVVHVK
jgi:plastocyanin